MSDSKKNKDFFTRVPQFVNSNINMFELHFSDDASLIRDIVLISSYNYGKDLFGYTTLTIDNFKNLGYNRSDLQRKHSNFKDLDSNKEKELIRLKQIELGIIQNEKDLSFKDREELKKYPFIHDHLCTSRLDYAFYKAFKTVLDVSIKENDTIIAKNLILLSELKIDNVSRVDKRKYSYKLSGSWIAHLHQSYHLLDLEDYISVGKGVRIEKANSAKTFYLYIGKMMAVSRRNIDENGNGIFDTTIDQVCEILNIKVSTPANKKKYITEFLNLMHGKIKRTLFSWYYFDPHGGRFKYHIKFIFSDEVLIFFDEGKKAILMKTIQNDAYSAFEIKKRNGEFARIKDLKDYDFWDWWIDENDLEIKEKIKKEAFKKAYNISLPTQEQSKINAKKDKVHRISYKEMENTALKLKKTALELAKEQGYNYDDKTDYFYKYK